MRAGGIATESHRSTPLPQVLRKPGFANRDQQRDARRGGMQGELSEGQQRAFAIFAHDTS